MVSICYHLDHGTKKESKTRILVTNESGTGILETNELRMNIIENIEMGNNTGTQFNVVINTELN